MNSKNEYKLATIIFIILASLFFIILYLGKKRNRTETELEELKKYNRILQPFLTFLIIVTVIVVGTVIYSNINILNVFKS